MNTGIIYKATCTVTGMCYIGQTVKSLEQRAKTHWQSKNVKSKFHDALIEFGKDAFVWEEIERVEESLLSEREQYWIAFYDSWHNGYNSDGGGCYSPKNRKRYYSKTSREVMSQKAKNRVPWNKGIKAGPCSEERKEHLREVWKSKSEEEMEKFKKNCGEGAKGNKSTRGQHWYKDENGNHIYYVKEA